MHKFIEIVQFASDITNRFLRYVDIETTSDEHSTTTPSTEGQKRLANLLTDELQRIGLSGVHTDQHGYVYATLPSNMESASNIPCIAFIAHLDTAPDALGRNIRPHIVRNYNGEDIVLNQEQNITMRLSDFPELTKYKGEDLIVTDGTTLLGADDKAGIAEIVTAMEWLCRHPEQKHGTVQIAFTPDEEIGRGADLFDVDRFGADWAYTVDGGTRGELEYENFNAARAHISIKGRNVHPGTAKGKMVNALLMASTFVNSLPANETPEKTEGYEGFYHLTNMSGVVEHAEIDLIIRDHDNDRFVQRKNKLQEILDHIARQNPQASVDLSIRDQYRNMREKIEPVMHVVDIARDAMTAVGIQPVVQPVRGGTDGAQLSFRNLPCPNIFAGGENFHGRYEYISVASMEKATEVILEIIRRTATQTSTTD